MVVGRIIHEGYKISRLLLILCAHLFTDICDEAEDSSNTCYCCYQCYQEWLDIIVIVYNNKNYVINILNCIIVSCYKGSVLL